MSSFLEKAHFTAIFMEFTLSPYSITLCTFIFLGFCFSFLVSFLISLCNMVFYLQQLCSEFVDPLCFPLLPSDPLFPVGSPIPTQSTDRSSPVFPINYLQELDTVYSFGSGFFHKKRKYLRTLGTRTKDPNLRNIMGFYLSANELAV